jgi:hypothetical protein
MEKKQSKIVITSGILDEIGFKVYSDYMSLSSKIDIDSIVPIEKES